MLRAADWCDAVLEALVLCVSSSVVIGSVLPLHMALAWCFGFAGCRIVLQCVCRDDLYQKGAQAKRRLHALLAVGAVMWAVGFVFSTLANRGRTFVYIFFAMFGYSSSGWHLLIMNIEEARPANWGKLLAVRAVIESVINSLALLAFVIDEDDAIRETFLRGEHLEAACVCLYISLREVLRLLEARPWLLLVVWPMFVFTGSAELSAVAPLAIAPIVSIVAGADWELPFLGFSYAFLVLVVDERGFERIWLPSKDAVYILALGAFFVSCIYARDVYNRNNKAKIKVE